MNDKDKIHKEALTQLVINALEFNASVVSYATQVLATTGGEALKKSSAQRVSKDFSKLGKAYAERYEVIIKDIADKAGVDHE